ncbi:unnamed protein product, partial [Ectocarpus sp. 12 AP-2014]
TYVVTLPYSVITQIHKSKDPVKLKHVDGGNGSPSHPSLSNKQRFLQPLGNASPATIQCKTNARRCMTPHARNTIYIPEPTRPEDLYPRNPPRSWYPFRFPSPPART